MKVKMNKILKLALVLVFVIGFTTISHAQFGAGGSVGGGSGPGGLGGPGSGSGQPGVPGEVPFDGGLSLILLAAGAGVSAKRKKVLAS